MRTSAAGPDALRPNHAFVLDWLTRNTPQGARVLDYGCGGGQVVVAGCARGLDVYGVERFYLGSHAREAAERTGMVGSRIVELVGDEIPFPDGFCHAVVSNQVLEHVQDLEVVVSELSRVLSPDGVALLLFPSREVVREGHIGVPLVHRFRSGSRARYVYTLVARVVGLGLFIEGKGRRQWAREALAWLDEYTFYRPRDEIHRVLATYFEVSHDELAYLQHRAGDNGLITRALRTDLGRRLASELVRGVMGMVLIARPTARR